MTGYGIFGTAVMFLNLMMQTSQQGMWRTNSHNITIVAVKTTAGKYSPRTL